MLDHLEAAQSCWLAYKISTEAHSHPVAGHIASRIMMPFDMDAFRTKLGSAQTEKDRLETERAKRVGDIVRILQEVMAKELPGTQVTAGKGWVMSSVHGGRKNLTIFVRDEDDFGLAYDVPTPDKVDGHECTEDDAMLAILQWPQKLHDDELEELSRGSEE